MKVAIIKYPGGNVLSVDLALKRLGIQPVVSADPEYILAADRIIFPGVGEAATTMQYLRRTGLDGLLTSIRQPFLGICLGMQLMCSRSEEGNVDCLGIFPEEVVRLRPACGEKVPHMGWNQVTNIRGRLMNNIKEGTYMYFIHSYYVTPGENTVAITDYVQPFSAALEKGNFFATQFHPEKSGMAGEQLLKNFINL